MSEDTIRIRKLITKYYNNEIPHKDFMTEMQAYSKKLKGKRINLIQAVKKIHTDLIRIKQVLYNRNHAWLPSLPSLENISRKIFHNGIYVVYDSMAQIIKIGFSICSNRRLEQFKKAYGNHLEIIQTISGNKTMERKIHSDLEKYSIKRNRRYDGYTEWFLYDDYVKSYLEERYA
jgi:uncharacterized protein YbbC (DUF1343 family)